MNVGNLFEMLSYGELKNLSMSSEGGGSIREEDQHTIILYANEALTRLYSRFILKEKDVLVELVGHVTNYHLIKQYAETCYDEEVVPYPYIKDLGREPFEEDVIKILSVINSNGEELPLNDTENPMSLFTPQATVLQVPRPVERQSLGILYQARHPELRQDETDGAIELPLVLQGALTSYIAHKVYGGMNTQEAMAVSQTHYANYEAICSEAVDKDLVNTSVSQTNTRFQKRGWI